MVGCGVGFFFGRGEVSVDFFGSLLLLELEGKDYGFEFSIYKMFILEDFEFEGVC